VAILLISRLVPVRREDDTCGKLVKKQRQIRNAILFVPDFLTGSCLVKYATVLNY